MSENRKLTEKEISVCLKAIDRLEQDKTYQIFQREYVDLMLNTGLWQNYIKQVNEFKQRKKDAEMQIIEDVGKIKILKSQIKDGVQAINKDRQKEEN